MTLLDRIARSFAIRAAEFGLSGLERSLKAEMLDRHASSMTRSVKIDGEELLFYAPFPGLQFRADTALSREPDTRAWIDSFERESVFWDIGANVGVYSLYATLRRQCISVAFEPVAANYYALARNVTLNHFDDRIHAYPVALSGATRLGVMNLSSESMGASRNQFGNPGEQSPYARGQFENSLQGMIGFTIDDFMRQFDPPFPNYLKMDVDGLEVNILSGATETLGNRSLKSVLIELSLTDNEETERGKRILANAGFNLMSTGYVEREGDLRAANHLFAR